MFAVLVLVSVTCWLNAKTNDTNLKDHHFYKACPVRGRTWDLLVFVYFLSQKQHLRPLGYCAPSKAILGISFFLLQPFQECLSEVSHATFLFPVTSRLISRSSLIEGFFTSFLSSTQPVIIFLAANLEARQ